MRYSEPVNLSGDQWDQGYIIRATEFFFFGGGEFENVQNCNPGPSDCSQTNLAQSIGGESSSGNREHQGQKTREDTAEDSAMSRRC